ncbi:ABC transporter substrate-binding protein [Streptomyces sp. NPDC005811]|uniref:ABC transporter substrate-binding protein n=1 Tax=Streptomyces sp. NPDC005811 TaxID=3154565 RepID=UPI0033DBD1E4
MSPTSRQFTRASRIDRRWLAPVVGAVLLTSACAGASDNGNSASSGASNPVATGAAKGDAVEKGVTDYLTYVGGKAGAADKSASPVTIGWVNVEGTANGAPEATKGAQAAVDYVNKELGGIGGHPLALQVCKIASAEEEGQRCGQEMLNDSAVSAVAFGNVFVGDQSFNSVLKGKKPVLVSVATGPSVPTAKDTSIIFGDLSHVWGPWGSYGRDVLHAKTAAILHTNTPPDKIAAEAARKAMESAGIKVKSVGFDAQATDLLGPVTAAGGQTADMIVPISAGQGCVGIAKALKQLGSTKPVVSTPVCLSPDVAQGLGGDLPAWTYGVAQTLPADSTAPDVQAYVKASSGAGLDKADQTKVWAATSWSTVLAYAKVMNEVGADKITPATVSAQLAKFQGPVVMGAPKVECGKYSDSPAVCNDQARFYQYKGKGVFTSLTGWLRPPA